MLTGKPKYGYGRGHRALEILSIGTFFALLVFLGIRVIGAGGAVNGWALAASLVGGFLASDFLSGLAHWAGDTVGDRDTPFIGAHFVTPFREHHVDPKGITRHDFIETNGNSCIASLPALVIIAVTMPRTAGWGFYLCILMASAAFFVFCTNQFHKWAHADQPPLAARWLQKAGLILTPTHHSVHHAAPHDKYYCITVGWMNPLLTRIGFWRFCEAICARINPAMLHLEGRELPRR